MFGSIDYNIITSCTFCRIKRDLDLKNWFSFKKFEKIEVITCRLHYAF